jgi:hypothetical protein
MIINIKHCYIPIELPDKPTAKDIEEVMEKYNGAFDYYSNSWQGNSYNQDSMRMRFDTLAVVRGEILEAIHEINNPNG